MCVHTAIHMHRSKYPMLIQYLRVHCRPPLSLIFNVFSFFLSFFFYLTVRNLATIICNLLAYLIIPRIHVRLPRWLSGKEPTCNAGDAGDVGSIPGLGKSLGEEKGNPLQYSCLGKSHGQRNMAGYSP